MYLSRGGSSPRSTATVSPAMRRAAVATRAKSLPSGTMTSAPRPAAATATAAVANCLGPVASRGRRPAGADHLAGRRGADEGLTGQPHGGLGSSVRRHRVGQTPARLWSGLPRRDRQAQYVADGAGVVASDVTSQSKDGRSQHRHSRDDRIQRHHGTVERRVRFVGEDEPLHQLPRQPHPHSDTRCHFRRHLVGHEVRERARQMREAGVHQNRDPAGTGNSGGCPRRPRFQSTPGSDQRELIGQSDQPLTACASASARSVRSHVKSGNSRPK